MSLRHREYSLENLEQRVLLSADGLAPTVSVSHELPSYSPADIILLDEHNGANQPAAGSTAAGDLVDTTAPAVNETVTTTDVAPAVTEITHKTPAAVSNPAPANPDVPSTTDLLVTTLTAGNGPPAPGHNYSVGGSVTADEYDPPFGGFNFTPSGSNAATEQAQLLALFSSGSGSTVIMHGTLVKRPDAGSSDYSQGLLSLEGTFNVARHLDGSTPAVDGSGNFVFEVWFNTALTSASLTVGGVALGFSSSNGAFLISGKLVLDAGDPTGAAPAHFDTGGAAGTIAVTSLLGLAGSGDDVFSFGTLTGGVLTFNSATALKNTVNPGMTSSANIGATGLGANFAGASANFVKLAGHVSITFGATVGLTFDGGVEFGVTGGAGNKVLSVALINATAAMSVAGVTATAAGINASFQISNAGVVGSTTIANLTVAGGGFTVDAFTNGSLSLDTTGTATPVFTIGATITAAISQGGISANLAGTFTFDRSTLGSEDVIRLAVSNASSSFSAGSALFSMGGISGSFVIKGNGFAGKAAVGTLTLTPTGGFTFGIVPPGLFFEINTTNDVINNLAIPSGQTLDYTTNDRKKFFRLQGSVTLGLDFGGLAVALDGTFYFEQYSADLDGAGAAGVTNVIKFAAIGANASFTAGSVKIGVSNVNGGFVIDNSGVAGFVTAAALDVSGLPSAVTIGGTSLSFAINTTGHAVATTFGIAESGQTVSIDYSTADTFNFVSVGGAINLGLTAGGAAISISGSISFYGGTVDGTEVVKVGLSGLNASMTIGGITATINSIEGIVVVMDAGVAGRVKFGSMTISGISAFNFAASDFAFEFNTTNLAIDEVLTVAGVTQELKYTTPETQNFFRGSGTAAMTITAGSFTTTISGTFAFEQFTMPDASKVVKVGFSGVHFELGLGSGGPKLEILAADGFFLFGQSSVTGKAEYAGRLHITDAKITGVSGFEFGLTDFNFEINTFQQAVSATIGTTFVLDYSTSDRFDFFSIGGVLTFKVTVGSFVAELTGSFYFEKASIAGLGNVFKVGASNLALTLKVGNVELSVDGGGGAFLINPDGIAGGIKLTGIHLTGLPHVDVGASVIAIELNTTGTALTNVHIPTSSNPADDVILDYDNSDFLRVHIEDGHIDAFGQRIAGTFTFEKKDNVIAINAQDVEVLFQAGSTTILHLDQGSASMLISPDGFAADLSLRLVSGPTLGGLVLTADSFRLRVNTHVAAITEIGGVTLADPLPGGGDYLAIEVEGFKLALGTTFSLTADKVAFEKNGSDVAIQIVGATFKVGTVFTLNIDADIAFSPSEFRINNAVVNTPSISLGSFIQITNPTLTITNLVVNGGGLVSGQIGISATSVLLFPGKAFSASITDGTDADTYGMTGNFNLITGAFVLTMDQFDLTVSTAFNVTASGVIISYDPDSSDPDQQLVEIDQGTITFPSLNGLFGSVENLIIRKSGFEFATLTVGLTGTVNIGSMVRIVAPEVVLTGFHVNYSTGLTITGGITVRATAASLFPGSSIFSISVSDDPLDADTIGISASFLFNNGVLDSFVFSVDKMTVTVGSFLVINAEHLSVNTGATGSQHIFDAALLGGTLNVPALGAITLKVHYLAITADGSLADYDSTHGFAVEADFTSSRPGAGSFKWPSWIPIRIETLALHWDDIGAHPADFTLLLSASVTSLPGASLLSFSGFVHDLVIDVGRLSRGEFPILSLGSVGVHVGGTIFGTVSVHADLILGMIKLDAANNVITDPQVQADHTVFYVGIAGGVTLTNFNVGADLSLGLAAYEDAGGTIHVVPLQAFIKVSVPILLEPISGLTLGSFTAGIQFNHSLEFSRPGHTYAEIDELKALTIAGIQNPDLAHWEANLRTSAIGIYINGSTGGDFTDLPMTITAGAEFYSSYVSKQALSGEVLVQVDTEGRFVVLGEMKFGGGNVKVNAKFYADTSHLTNGSVVISFYADAGSPLAAGQPAPFAMWGVLKIEVFGSNPATPLAKPTLTGGVENPTNIAGATTVRFRLDGGGRVTQGGVVTLQVEGFVDLEISVGGGATTVKLAFAATASMLNPPGNPLGNNFASIAGAVVLRIADSGGTVELYGAFKLTFNGDAIQKYGIDVNSAEMYLQLNTTATDQPLTLTFVGGATENVVIRKQSFSIFIRGDIGLGTPPAVSGGAVTHLLDLKGFLILEIDSTGLTLAVHADITLAPGGQQMLKFDVTGFLRIQANGLAAKLTLTRAGPDANGNDGNFPASTGLKLEGTFTLLINTTRQTINYDVPDWADPTAPNIVIPNAAPAFGGQLDQPSSTAPPGGEAYFLIYVNGSVTALGGTFRLDGEFFIVITETEFQMAVDATLKIGPSGSPFITFTAKGFMKITADGIAARLDLGVAGTMPAALQFTAGFTLIINTTGQVQTYTVKDSTGAPQLITIAQAAPEIGGNLEVAADIDSNPATTTPGASYFLLTMTGGLTVTAAPGVSVSLTGDFFIIITATDVQLQINADLSLGGINMTVHGFLKVSGQGAAGLLEVSSSVNIPGLTIINASFFVAFNTFSSTYVLPPSVIAAFNLDPGTSLESGQITIRISGTVKIGGLIELDGLFLFEHRNTSDLLKVQASIIMPVIGTLSVKGDLVLYHGTAHDGAVGSLEITVTSGNRSALALVGITFDASLVLKVNTTNATTDVLAVTATTGFIAASTVRVTLQGSVTLINQFKFEGKFYFEKSGSDLRIDFEATLKLDPLGTLSTTGHFFSSDSGFNAQLAMTIDTSSVAASLGFKLSGNFVFVINTLSSVYTVTGLTGNLTSYNNTLQVGQNGMVLLLDGDLVLFGTLHVTGSFKLVKTANSIEFTIKASLGIPALALSFSLNGTAIITTDNPNTAVNEGGIVLRVELGSKTFGIASLFSASGSFTLELNTTGVDATVSGHAINAGSFLFAVNNLELDFLFILKFHGSLTMTYDGPTSLFTLTIEVDMNFFDIVTLHADGYFDSRGNFDVHFSGDFFLGIPDFLGFGGSADIHVVNTVQPNGTNHLTVHGQLDGSGYIIGIRVFHGVLGLNYDSASGLLSAYFELELNFFFFSITIGASFDIGYFMSPPTTYQAGDAGNPLVWSGSGQLVVNVGGRASSRNYSIGEKNEQVIIKQQGTQIIVDIFGQAKVYDGATSVVINAGDGDDVITIDSSVTVPVYIYGGDGNDIITNNGSGLAYIYGQGNSDQIIGGSGTDYIFGGDGNDIIHGGGGSDLLYGEEGNDVISGDTGVDYIYGGNGNDTLYWAVGDGADAAIDGGFGTDTLSLAGTDPVNSVLTGADEFVVSQAGLNFNVLVKSPGVADVTLNTSGTAFGSFFGATAVSPASGIEGLVIDTLGGNDRIKINYLGNSTLADIAMLLKGGNNTVEINGNNSSAAGDGDIFRATSTTDNPFTFLTIEPDTLTIASLASLTATSAKVEYRILNSTYPNDVVTINGNGGNDLVDASNVIHARVKFVLKGGDGDDTLVGSSYADEIYGDAGNDTLTGGPGVDTFGDSSGTDDRLVEYMDRNYTLNGWTLTSGPEVENLPHVFETISLAGGNSANSFTLSNLATNVLLNGANGNDSYYLNVAGSGVYSVEITDTGTNNVNNLYVYGTAGADDFLLRLGVITVGNDAANGHQETFKFAGIDALEIHAGEGNDSFTVDETTVAATIWGDGGEDSFKVGRILVAKTTANPNPTPPSDINYISSTRGYLSYGNRAALTINGGTENDYFEINHNQATLQLNGDDGDDLFLLRTYLQEGSVLSNVAGGNGTNTINYVANGPVKIDGGAGFDKLVLEGTEADDDFIVTDTGIFGGGREIEFTNIESITILAGDGDDSIWILANNLPIEVQGGSGNDTVHIGGQAPDYVYDAPEVLINPPPVTTWVPTFVAVNFTYTSQGYFSFGGSFPFFHWVAPVTYSITLNFFTGFQQVTTYPPQVHYDPLPVTYRFAEVTNFTGVLNGVESYNWAGPRDQTKSVANDPNNPLLVPGRTPDATRNIGVFNAPVRVIGDSSPGDPDENDLLWVHLTGAAGDLTGTLDTADEVTTRANGTQVHTPIGQLQGFNLPTSFLSQGRTFLGGITFRGLESARFDLGTHNDTINILSTFEAVNVTVNGNDGNDTVNVRANTGTVTLNGQAGNDTFNLGSNAPVLAGGNLDGLQGAIIVDGGTGTDSLNLDDRGDTIDNVLTLTQTTIAGMGMGAGITSYVTIENLRIGFGSGADIANVQGTAAGTLTTLQLNDGDDSIYVSNTAAVTTASRATTFTLGGHLDDVDGTLLIQGGNGRQRLMVSDRDTTSPNGTAGAPAVITGSALTGFSTGTINYSASATGDYGNGITIWTGAGADFVNVASIFLRAGIRNSTSLNTGAGADTININLANAPNAFFAVHAGSGNDIINATGSLGLLIFGGDGADTITTGVGNQLIFGDEGSASYLDGLGNLVARYGSGGIDDFTDAVIRDLSLATTVVSVGGVDTITTSSGNDLIFGGAAGDIINAGEGDNLVVGDHASITLSGGLLTGVTSLLNGGGNDTIITGAGRDLIVGGSGSDGISAGAGSNFVLGDHGTIVLAGNIVTGLATMLGDGAGDSIITLGGRDFILGGEGSDFIQAGDGDNAVAGDHGTFTIMSPVAFTFSSSNPTVGGDDTITTGANSDTIIGGFGADTINAGDGFNVVFGDHGSVSRDVAAGAFTVASASEAVGGNDSITTGTGIDVILGGAGSDTIVSGAGNDLVFGDSGTATFAAGLPVSTATTAFDTGAGDNITTGDGADVVFGGDGADTIDAGNGQNVVFGDYGTVNWTGANLLNATAIAAGAGGVDNITTGLDNDIIFGGTAGDTIHAGAGADVVFGDQGLVSFTSGLATNLSNTAATGDGSDTIFGDAGNDVILGGGAGDTIDAGGDDNTIVGDHATLVRSVNGSVLATVAVSSSEQGIGGNDTITSGSGNDWIIGGAGDDTINAGDGVNVVFGDEAQLTTLFFQLHRVASSTANAGNDTIISGSGTNYIVGGAGSDTITVGGGTSVVFGDQGQIDWNGGVLIDATTFGANSGARDVITVGDGTSWIFGGDGDDDITAGNGFVVAFGDHGSIDLTGAGVLTVLSVDFTSGGDDTITTGAGDDIILGGFGSDTINGGEGNNVVFGDHGEVIKTAAGLDWIATLAPTQGAVDTITTGAGNDIILGGAGNDVIHAGAGRNVILGDHGSLDFTANDLRTAASSDFTYGGDDLIDAGAGSDLVLGGVGADRIDAGDGDNVVFGDHGTVVISGGVLIDAFTVQPTLGAADIITTGLGSDVILGGVGADRINAGQGDNFIVGDHAELHWIAGILARMLSINFTAGAKDDITSGDGDDVILAGPDDDTIDAGNGDNVVFGDNGFVYWTSGVIVQATTEDAVDVGGADTITTGSGQDLIFGGAAADTIHAGAGADAIFGDNGDALFGGGLLASLQTLTPAYSANDTIFGESGNDIILAGQGADNVSGGDDDDIILGDEGLVLLSGGAVQSFTSESFADGSADTLNGDNGNDFILGGNGADTINGGEGNNVIVGDNGRFTMPGTVLARVEILAPLIGAADTITAGAGNDVIMGGAAGDLINGGNGDNVVIGDHGTITFLGGVFATFTPTTPEIGGNDTITTGSGADRIVGGTGADWINAGDGNNVVVGDHAFIVQNNGLLTSVESTAFADGGVDLIFTGAGNDLVIGGTAGDTIHSGAGNDLVFGDHARIAGNIDLALLPLAMAVHPFTFTSISTQNAGADGRSVAGDDVVFAGEGDDIVLGQQGNDILFGEDGDDDLIGGHNVSLGQDGADVIDGGAGFDVLAGDNASILRRGDNVSPRAHVLAGNAMFDDRGNFLDLDTPQAWPTAVPERDTIILDHAYGTDASLFGNDQLIGGAGDDVIFGQLGNDQLHGDATLPVTIAADGTIDRAAVRDTATALFTTNFWGGSATDGDDYLEGNGGEDLIFGGLGQDDIIGGSSSLFGLTDRTLRPDGSDTIYGGNGTQADDQSPGDASANGRARDADVIMGDNANIFRLVGINGVNVGAFLTFHYNTTGTLRIVVRGFDLLDYTIPAATTDIGAADRIYGEDGDDTLHGEVGDDLMYGNGNDDNLYGGQGDDNLFGGAGDDSISHSDELKAPPPAPGQGGASDGNGAAGTAGGTIPIDLPGNVQIILVAGGGVGVFRQPAPAYYTSVYTTAIGQPAGDQRLGMFRGMGNNNNAHGSWRVFSSGVLPSVRFGEYSPNTPSLLNEPAGADKPKKDGEDQVPSDNPATPENESQPATPADQQEVPVESEVQVPVSEQSAPVDTQPAQGENPPPAKDNAGTPPPPENPAPPTP